MHFVPHTEDHKEKRSDWLVSMGNRLTCLLSQRQDLTYPTLRLWVCQGFSHIAQDWRSGGRWSMPEFPHRPLKHINIIWIRTSEHAEHFNSFTQDTQLFWSMTYLICTLCHTKKYYTCTTAANIIGEKKKQRKPKGKATHHQMAGKFSIDGWT